jgi:hypothetical protein
MAREYSHLFATKRPVEEKPLSLTIAAVLAIRY